MSRKSANSFGYHSNNEQKLPTELFVFRNGANEGQIEEIQRSEVRELKNVLTEHGFAEYVKLNYVVNFENHHIRLFPDDSHTDKFSNCCPGTIIDTEITSPFTFNFILQSGSQSNLQDKCLSSIYHVLLNESNLTSDQMQQLCFNLCFLSQTATHSISVVAPSFRARIAEKFARMFLKVDNISSPSSLLTLNEKFGNKMYYM
jgi:eukaryotic translation initiation factor 2C